MDYTAERERRARKMGSQTEVTPITDADLDLFRYVARGAILNQGTRWRHNGQGVLQGYLYDVGGSEARVHIWHKDLRSEGIFDNGLIHDHRFDMRSHVILGSIQHLDIRLCHGSSNDGECGQIMELTSARKAKTGDSFRTVPVEVGQRVVPTSTPYMLNKSTYTFPGSGSTRRFRWSPLRSASL